MRLLRRQATEPEAEPYGSDASIVQCLAIMREISSEQRDRARHLDTKAASVAGFCATALALNLTFGAPLLRERFAGSTHALIRDFFVVSAVMFAAAATVAVAGVLRPLPTDDLDDDAIDGYAMRPKVTTPAPALRETWLQTVTAMTLADRRVGNSKATRSTVAAILLVLGVLSLAAEAITLALA